MVRIDILLGYSRLMLLILVIFVNFNTLAGADSSPVKVSINPAYQVIETGKEFNISILIDPVNKPITAVQFNLLFNSSAVEVRNVTEGELFKQSGADTIFNSGIPDNSEGRLINVWDLIITPGKNVSSKAAVAEITMYAKYAGTPLLNLTNVIISDPYSQAVQINITNGSIGISNPDTTPPASVTDLRNITYAQSYINWTWSNPEDPDFSGVMVFVNGLYRVNIPKDIQYYNATYLAADTIHTINTHTVDSSGNINNSWINHTAWTASDIEPSSEAIFFDDFDSEKYKWASSGLWHATTKRSNSPDHSWWYGQEPTQDYNTGTANSGELVSPVVSLENTSKPVLSFMSWYQTEHNSNYDKKLVQISVNNSPWTNLKQISHVQKAWVKEQIDISSYAGSAIKVRFYFNTVDRRRNNFEGWYIDNVRLE